MKVAALDAGLNTFHLVVAEAAPDGAFAIVDRAKEMVRIGEGTLRTRTIPTDGFERGIEALGRLRRCAEAYRPDVTVAVATAAIREATNGGAFVRAAREEAGVHLRVIDATEEARLIYLGARRTLDLGRRRVALFDLGGGSLEIIVADAERIHLVRSLPLGGLRLAQTFDLGDPPRPAELAVMRRAVRGALEPVMAEIHEVGYDFVALASGTANTVRSMLAAGSGGQRPPDVHLTALRGLEEQVAVLPAAARGRLPGMAPGRIDSLVPGLAVLRAVVELAGKQRAVFSTGAIREGIVADQIAGWTGVRAPASSTVERELRARVHAD